MIASAYNYAGPGNRFWPMLAKTGLTPRQLRPDEFPLLLDFGIGLTDVAKTVSGADVDLPAHAFDRVRLHARMAEVQPGCLAFNGKKAVAMALGRPTRLLSYGPVPHTPGWPPLVVLPSTSGAASGFWDPAPWFASPGRSALAEEGFRKRSGMIVTVTRPAGLPFAAAGLGAAGWRRFPKKVRRA